MSTRALPAGSVRATEVTRRFKVVHDRSLTLKETILRRRRRVVGEDFWALKGIDLDVPPGQSVGIVGRNGSGKSTLLKVLAGILPPSSGEVEVAGTVASILELGAGFSPDFSGWENVFLNAAILGIPEEDVRASIDEIIAFAELEDFIHAPVRTYSSGMQVRLAFSIASHVRADILILDEVFAVGDEAFQRKCLGRMFDFRRGGGTILFVSHSAEAVERICDRVVLLEAGEIVAEGPSREILTDYHRLLSERSSRTGAKVEVAPREEERGDLQWGNREFVIRDVRLLDEAGASRTSFQQGESMTVELDWERREPALDSLNVGVAIQSVEGALCVGTNTVREGIRVPVEAGAGTVRMTFPELMLNAGRFTVTLALGPEDEGEVYHGLERWLSFDVYPTLPRVGLFAMETVVDVVATPRHGDVGVPSPPA